MPCCPGQHAFPAQRQPRDRRPARTDGIAIAPADAVGDPPQLSEPWLKALIQRLASRRVEQVRQITQSRFKAVVEAFIDVTKRISELSACFNLG